jgi:hypothetical protein
MRALCRLLGLLLLITAGCRSLGPDLEPPPMPENFETPPETDHRYSEHPKQQRDPGTGALVPRMSSTFTPKAGPRSGMGRGGF